jgi:hypothetical protein
VGWSDPTLEGYANSGADSTQAGDTGDFYSSGPLYVLPQTPTTITGISSTPGAWTCDPPLAPNPLTATVAQLQAQVTTLDSNLADMTYLKAYWFDAYASQLNAANTYRAQLAAANATIATL